MRTLRIFIVYIIYLSNFISIGFCSVQKVSDIVSILKMFGISKQQVLQYPRVFAHSPHKVLGPRLKVLSKYAPDKYVVHLLCI